MSATETFQETLGPAGDAFYVVAPVGPSGIAFLGDAGKFVGTGKQRIAAIQDAAGGLKVSVLCLLGESPITLHGYSLAAPQVSVSGGKPSAITYDLKTQHFTVTISPTAPAVTVIFQSRKSGRE